MPGTKPGAISNVLTVGEVAARSGVAISTLHFYESQGLIKSWRNRGNQRRYPREVLRRVAVIKVAQRTGIPLAIIREALAALPDRAYPTPKTGNSCRPAGGPILIERIPGASWAFAISWMAVLAAAVCRSVSVRFAIPGTGLPSKAPVRACSILIRPRLVVCQSDCRKELMFWAWRPIYTG